MTPEEQVSAIRTQLSDRRFRVSTLYPILDTSSRTIRMRPNWAQWELFEQFHYRNQVLKVRKLGISTFVAIGVILDSCLFTDNLKAAIIDETEDDAKKKLAMIKFAWDHAEDERFHGEDFPSPTRPLWLWIKNHLKLRLEVDSKTELRWSNGSSVYADVSLRGDTPQILHISELGAIAANKPERAKDIVSGSFNSVAIGNFIIAESTHQGGRYGVNYDYIKKAMESVGRPLTPLDWRFFFFPWHKEPKYRLPIPPDYRLQFTAKQQDYFAALEKRYAMVLTPEQKFWYATMSEQPHADMAHEFPGTVEEALSATTEGAIYGEQMAALRAAGRIREFVPEGEVPLDTFWDLGCSDFTCIWLLQFAGRDVLALNYRTGWMETIAHYAVSIHEWERQYGRPIARHYVPHDAGHHKSMDGKTTVDLMREAGLRNVIVVPRTPDRSVGIKHLRALLPKFVFHSRDCDRETMVGQRRLPSGLGAMEGYRYAPQVAGGAIKLEPLHDDASNGADALRTYAEAHLRGMLTERNPMEVAGRAVGVGQLRGSTTQGGLPLDRANPMVLRAWPRR